MVGPFGLPDSEPQPIRLDVGLECLAGVAGSFASFPLPRSARFRAARRVAHPLGAAQPASTSSPPTATSPSPNARTSIAPVRTYRSEWDVGVNEGMRIIAGWAKAASVSCRA